MGNLVYRKTARNFGPVMATAAKITIAEVRRVVEIGRSIPESVVTPGIFVDRIVDLGTSERAGAKGSDDANGAGRMRRARTRTGQGEQGRSEPGRERTGAGGAGLMIEHTDRGPRNKNEIAEAVAADIPDGSYVNLGIGQPTTVADYLTAESGVVLHTENGMLNMGRAAVGDEIDPDLINAGKVPVIELPGAAYFHHADSFAMMRGGHLDVCVLGAFQVSQDGDLANWHTGAPDAIPAVGGAMDLATGAKDVFVMMTMFTKSGRPSSCRRAAIR